MRRVPFAILVVLSLIFMLPPAGADVGGEVTAESDAAAAVEPVELDAEVTPPPVEPEPVPSVVEPDPVPAEVTVVAPPVDDPWSWSGIGWQLAGYVVPVLGSMFVALVAFGIAWLRSKTDNMQWRRVLDQTDDAVRTVVAAVQQTMVDAMDRAAESGKLTKEDASLALAKALAQVKEILGTKGLDALRSGMGAGRDALDVFLRAKIEAEVAARKNGMTTATVRP